MIIAPSLLAANHGKLAAEAERAVRAGADWLHVDIMDGHFVSNLTFGPGTVAAVRRVTRRPLDVHLMCSRPASLLPAFRQAGAANLTVHVELGERVTALLWQIKALGALVGLAVNPPTPIASVRPFLHQIDLLLVMTVNPGSGGQSFIEETIPKIQKAAAWRRELNLRYHIEVDGGVNFDTAVECARAGADTFVSGTALFGQHSLKRAIRKFRRIVEAHAPAPARPSPPAAAVALPG